MIHCRQKLMQDKFPSCSIYFSSLIIHQSHNNCYQHTNKGGIQLIIMMPEGTLHFLPVSIVTNRCAYIYKKVVCTFTTGMCLVNHKCIDLVIKQDDHPPGPRLWQLVTINPWLPTNYCIFPKTSLNSQAPTPE